MMIWQAHWSACWDYVKRPKPGLSNAMTYHASEGALTADAPNKLLLTETGATGRDSQDA